MINASSRLGTLVTIAVLFVFGTQGRAQDQTYPIDCAILLCLAGGWPASAPCANARAEFIRRITPWPIEPPLQIWRCPMHAALEDPDPARRLRRIAETSSTPPWSITPEPETLHLAQAVGLGADIDVSGKAFDFIRSIDVFQVQARQHESGETGECNRYKHIRHGTYDATGQFRWSLINTPAVPPAFQGLERYGEHCPNLWVRSVFVDWEDSQGRYGFEQVDY
ncbi:hypothetical protein KU6B_57650 (plasmid) [Mameliella alba]|uniref:hypothetical protein n=1 Tax=Mameliella alba TaxID=561184 RepID=UPI000841073D|nr:hypothetical protein [Mameliella alba]ODM45143.1 hypothetical protein A9320_28060 [Ruegeria sp. PBVC088]BBU59500.1 hypothetical protein KU6B_57650 [Mameliella alba]